MKKRIKVKLSWSGWFVVNHRGNLLCTLESFYESQMFIVNLKSPPVYYGVHKPSIYTPLDFT